MLTFVLILLALGAVANGFILLRNAVSHHAWPCADGCVRVSGQRWDRLQADRVSRQNSK